MLDYGRHVQSCIVEFLNSKNNINGFMFKSKSIVVQCDRNLPPAVALEEGEIAKSKFIEFTIENPTKQLRLEVLRYGAANILPFCFSSNYVNSVM
jgi:hypothetical protein